MKVLVFTDLHYFGGENPVFNTAKKLVKYAEPMLDEFAAIVREENIDMVVNLGDIIQDTWNKELDKICLKKMFDRLKEFDCPVYSVLGNHDLKMMDTVSEVEEIMGHPSTFSFDKEGFHFVFLTTDVRPELGLDRGGSYKTQTLPDETLTWLENDLENNNLPCFIFTHFVIAEYESVKDECMFLKNRAEVKKIFAKHNNIKAVFSGHQHTPKTIEENGITHYVVGSPTSSPEANGVPLGIYAVIETENSDMSVVIKKIDSLRLF